MNQKRNLKITLKILRNSTLELIFPVDVWLSVTQQQTLSLSLKKIFLLLNQLLCDLFRNENISDQLWHFRRINVT